MLNLSPGTRVAPLLALAVGATGWASSPSSSPSANAATGVPSEERCRQDLTKLPGKFDPALAELLCKGAIAPSSCASVQGAPIYAIDHPPSEGKPMLGSRRILVLGLTHGDEPESGSLVRDWMLRLSKVDHRNHWYFVPVLNPDGWAKNTRENANGVDLNRNFPTADWDENAHLFWKKITGKNIRRFPGNAAGSEPETRCAVKIIEDFQPELIVSVHTPYGLLDFDGPSTPLPKIPNLPAKRLGNFPGSLGRYMWADRKVPVLTVELHGGSRLLGAQSAEKLQDSIGDLVLRINRRLAATPSPQEAHGASE